MLGVRLEADFTLTDEMAIGKGTEGEKYADKLAAIRTLKLLEAENRRATPADKEILARYVGWGGAQNAFRVAGSAEGIAKGWEYRLSGIGRSEPEMCSQSRRRFDLSLIFFERRKMGHDALPLYIGKGRPRGVEFFLAHHIVQTGVLFYFSSIESPSPM